MSVSPRNPRPWGLLSILAVEGAYGTAAVGLFVWSWPGLIVLDGNWSMWPLAMAPVAVGAIAVLVLGGLTMFGAVYRLNWTLARRASVWVLSAMALLPFAALPILVGIFLGPIFAVGVLAGGADFLIHWIVAILGSLYPLIFIHGFWLVVSYLPRRMQRSQ